MSSWLDLFAERGEDPAIFEGDEVLSYGGLAAAVRAASGRLAELGVGPQSVVVLHADFSRAGIAALFALIDRRAIIIPMVNLTSAAFETVRSECGAELLCRVEPELTVERLGEGPREGVPPSLYAELGQRDAAGLVLLSSGSTGKPKAILHDLHRLVEARLGKSGRKRLSIVLFLLFDHIGGINTLLNSLFSGGKAIVVPERTPEAVCRLIEKHRATILPISPSFLNLILIGGFHRQFDLGSLRLITYGTEPMPDSLLRRVREAFPRVRLLQTFGTSETGIATTASELSSSTFFKIKGGDVAYRIVDGELQLKSSTQFLGYLNQQADNLTEDGWFKTGDLVEEAANGFIRIRGRSQEVINVGGEKVLPVEVESLLLQSPKIADCLVYGEPNAITGQIVCTNVVLREPISKLELRRHIFELLAGQVDRFKIPSRINIVEELAHSDRFKKRRTAP
jgi:acyl-CoA synthetase (AMP-forming)/AMP-acid ligase II